MGDISEPALSELHYHNTMDDLNNNRRSTQPSNHQSEVERIASELATDITYYLCGLRTSPINHVSPTMRRVVEDILRRHEYRFNGIMSRLNDLTLDSAELTFMVVIREMFQDGEVNWGRIASIYAFAGRLAKDLSEKEHNTVEVAQTVAEMCSTVVVHSLKDWIQRQGGWVSESKVFFL